MMKGRAITGGFVVWKVGTTVVCVSGKRSVHGSEQ